jgi:hypothetical protein
VIIIVLDGFAIVIFVATLRGGKSIQAGLGGGKENVRAHNQLGEEGPLYT